MKKLVSVILCVLLIVGSLSVSSFSAATAQSIKQAIEIYEAESGEKVNTNRYYFLMPDGTNGKLGKDDWFFKDEYTPSWYNDNTNHAGIYWWDTGKIDPDSWPGYKMYKADSDSVFFADVPDFVEAVVFNNNFDGGTDPSSPVYNDSKQTANIYTCGYEPEESEIYPQGLESFDNMIFVIDPDMYMYGDTSSVGKIWWGEWFYYYKNGCYGTVKDGNEHNCIRDDHNHERLYINFDPADTGWTDYENIYCSFATEGGWDYYPEKSLPTLCSDYDGDGIYTYDLNKSGIKIEKYGRYAVSFYTDNNQRTTSLLMQIGNLKDTIYATGEYVPSGISNKRCVIEWTNKVPIDLRPIQSLKDALSEYDKEHGTKTPTYRYYFLMPNGVNGQKGDIEEDYYYGEYAQSWYNEYTDQAGIYWWDSPTMNPDSFPAYAMEKADSDCIFYADVPQAVETVIFNNALSGGMNQDHEIFYKARQSLNIPCYVEEDLEDFYPQGVENLDNMIFVINPSINNINDFSARPIQYGGKWYYYYGYGCYGTAKGGDYHDCIRNDHDHSLEPDTATLSAKEALKRYESINNVKLKTHRYYFMMPNGTNGNTGVDSFEGKFVSSWYNEYTCAPAAYWWDSTDFVPDAYPGYVMEKADTDNVFYADVPDLVTMIIFNNNINFPYGEIQLNKKYHCQTGNIACEYYDPGESENYPNGTKNFDKMIYVLHPSVNTVSDLNQKQTYKGEWYYYYGNDCYGTVKNGNSSNCIHPSHYDSDGNHIDIFGDADRDGVLSIMDATEIQMVITQLKNWKDDKAEALSDFDKDGTVSVMDATAIQMLLVEI